MSDDLSTNYLAILSDPELCNCIKCHLALSVARTGLKEFVKNTMQIIKDSIYSSTAAAACEQCCIENIVPCYTKGVCSGPTSNCRFHATPDQMPKLCSHCNLVFIEIAKMHRYEKPTWKNTNAKKWSSDYWEIAKCFLPPDGYRNVNSFDDLDFNGYINIMINCKDFEQCFSFPFAEGSDLLQKARIIGRTVRHNSVFSINESDKRKNFKILLNLLSDPAFANDNEAKRAIQTLKKIDSDDLYFKRNDCKDVLEDILEKMKEVTSLSEEMTQRREKIQRIVKLKHRFSTMLKSVQRMISETHSPEIFPGMSPDDYVLFESPQMIFLEDSIKHYTKSYERVHLFRHVQEFVSLKDIFVNPCINKLVPSISREVEKISSFKDIFTCDGDNKTDIYMYGSPGVGKTTLCKKIVLEWCYRMKRVFEDQKTTSSQGEKGLQQRGRHCHAFTDVDFLDQFDFILPIFLHRSQGFCDVDKMIKYLVVDNFAKSSFYTQEFLQKILDEKKCLVILDGLDEWKHPHDCLKGHSDIPHRKTRGRCTILTTTRYENLAVTESSPRYEMQMKGFDTETSDLLIERVFKAVDVSSKGLNNFKHMTGLMKAIEIRHLFANPTMLMQVIGLCLEYRPICKSRCEVYTAMLAILLDNTESKHRGTLDMKRLDITDQYRKLSLPQQMLENKVLKKYHNFVIMLAEFAFQITLGRQDTFCFDELLCEELKLPSAVLNIARVSGIFVDVIDHKSKIQSMTFMDKSYQAFFCAIYLCNLPQAIENVIERDTAITTQSFDQINRNFASLLGAVEMPLIFAAGLNVESHRYICDALSRNLEDTLLRHLNVAEYVHSFIAFLQNVQVFNKCIVSANEEGLKNQSQRPYHIQHIASAGWKFKTDMKKASDLKNNVKTVLLHDVSLDNSNYKRLIAKEPNIHTIWLNGVNMSEMHLPGNVQRILLNNCILPIICDFSNYKDVTFFQAHILSESITTPNSSLEVCIVKYTKTAAEIKLYPFTSSIKVLQLSDVILNSSLDLSVCINLNSLHLDNVQFKGQLKVNTSQLEECVLKKLSSDISTNVCSILMSATNLKKLHLSDLEMDNEPRTACVTKLFYCCSGQTHLNLSRAVKICDLSMDNLKVTKISINGTALQRCSLSDLRANKIQFTTSFGTMLQTYHISSLSETLCQHAFQYLDPSHVQTIRIAESPCHAMMIERINHMSNAEEIHMRNVDISEKCLKFPQRVRVICLESLVVDNNSELVIPSSTETIELIGIENVPFIDLKNAKLRSIAIRTSSISREVLETFVQEISEMGIEVECIFDACALEDANSGTLNFRYHNEAWHMAFICCRSEILPTIINVTDKIDTITFDNVGDKDNRLIETSGCGGLSKVSKIEIANCSNLDQFCYVLKDASRLKTLALENMNLTDYVFQGVESSLNRTIYMLTPRTCLTRSIRNVYLSNCTFTNNSLKKNVSNIFLMAQRVKFTLVESSIRIDDNDTETYRIMKCTINNTRRRKFLYIHESKYGPLLQNLLCDLNCLTHLEIHEMDLEKTEIMIPNAVRTLKFDHCEMSKDSLIILNDNIEDLSFKWVFVVPDTALHNNLKTLRLMFCGVRDQTNQSFSRHMSQLRQQRGTEYGQYMTVSCTVKNIW